MKLCKFFTFLYLFFPLLVFAENQALPILEGKAEQFLKQSINADADDIVKIKVDKIDSRLQLKQCPEAMIEVFDPFPHSATTNKTIGLRCLAEHSTWTIYVPVKTKIYRRVIIAARPINQGQIVRENDLRIEEKEISQLKQGYVRNSADIINQICRRNIGEGQIMRSDLLQPPYLVHKGEQVIVEAITGSIKVTIDATALEDGSLNDTIKVKNIKGERIVEAKVVDNKKVQIVL